MVSKETFRKIALSFDSVTEQPHFQKTSFRIGTKIFATLDTENKKAVVKLSEVDQSVFCAYNNQVMYPVAGSWGKQGWTMIELTLVPKGMLTDALQTAYQTLASSGKKSSRSKP
ncbi:MAG TPA: MmcQ/YjbR family DNA-binding protein [Flavisolibacter sp.]|nr:MmcQ/YjbR family DNA-binding protein [Flavisolibacter sp.]